MRRRARIVAAGYPMHAILRGIDRTAIFFADEDNRYFLAKLAELAATESVAVHAYVLMTNHVHLLMTPETEDGISKLMKGVGQRYVYSTSTALTDERARCSRDVSDRRWSRPTPTSSPASATSS